jgi:hypothetical protein
MGEMYDCTMIFSWFGRIIVPCEGQTLNHRAHYLFGGFDYYVTTMIFFIGLDKPLWLMQQVSLSMMMASSRTGVDGEGY